MYYMVVPHLYSTPPTSAIRVVLRYTCAIVKPSLTNRLYFMTLPTASRIFLKGSSWYFIGDRYQGSHANLYVLLMAAKKAER
jgi:hypothetical protein